MPSVLPRNSMPVKRPGSQRPSRTLTNAGPMCRVRARIMASACSATEVAP